MANVSTRQRLDFFFECAREAGKPVTVSATKDVSTDPVTPEHYRFQTRLPVGALEKILAGRDAIRLQAEQAAAIVAAEKAATQTQ